MNSDDQVIIDAPSAESVSDRPTSVFLPVTAPRIHTPINDLPSRGFELIDFADQIIPGGFMPWQKWLAEHSLKIKPDGRYYHPVTVASGCPAKWEIHIHDGADHDGFISLARVAAGLHSSPACYIAGAISIHCAYD
jgi:hypothetical protein